MFNLSMHFGYLLGMKKPGPAERTDDTAGTPKALPVAWEHMERVMLDPEGDAGERDAVKRTLSDALGTTAMALNHYRIATGEGLPGGLHTHADQEEVFVVLDGEATFETLSGEVTVASGEAVRFVPGEFQSGRNGGDVELAVLALGAPRDTRDIRIPFECPDCWDDELRFGPNGRFVCPDCDGEHTPAPCPDCESEDLEGTVGEEGSPVVICRECEATFDRPPLAE